MEDRERERERGGREREREREGEREREEEVITKLIASTKHNTNNFPHTHTLQKQQDNNYNIIRNKDHTPTTPTNEWIHILA